MDKDTRDVGSGVDIVKGGGWSGGGGRGESGGRLGEEESLGKVKV